MTYLEFTGILHGFLATIFLMSFTGAMFELIYARYCGMKILKISAVIMTISIILTNLLGNILYIFYRAPDPTSPRSLLLASNKPWIHTIFMELKEHIGNYVPVLLIVATFLIYYYGDEVCENKKIKTSILILLIAAMLWTLLTFGLGAFITKAQPLI